MVVQFQFHQTPPPYNAALLGQHIVQSVGTNFLYEETERVNLLPVPPLSTDIIAFLERESNVGESCTRFTLQQSSPLCFHLLLPFIAFPFFFPLILFPSPRAHTLFLSEDSFEKGQGDRVRSKETKSHTHQYTGPYVQTFNRFSAFKICPLLSR